MAKRVQSSKAAQCLKLPDSLPRGHHTRLKSFHHRNPIEGNVVRPFDLQGKLWQDQSCRIWIMLDRVH